MKLPPVLTGILDRCLPTPKPVRCVVKVCVLGVFTGDWVISGVTLHRRNGWSKVFWTSKDPEMLRAYLQCLRGRRKAYFHAVVHGDDVLLEGEVDTEPAW